MSKSKNNFDTPISSLHMPDFEYESWVADLLDKSFQSL